MALIRPKKNYYDKSLHTCEKERRGRITFERTAIPVGTTWDCPTCKTVWILVKTDMWATADVWPTFKHRWIKYWKALP